MLRTLTQRDLWDNEKRVLDEMAFKCHWNDSTKEHSSPEAVYNWEVLPSGAITQLVRIERD